MSARLVVNADDFGLTDGTNRAIIDAHRTGIVTSTSLMANGVAFDHAIRLAAENPSLDVGLHLTLTEGLPITDGVPELLDKNGALPLSNQPFVFALLAGRLPSEAIRIEFEAQVQKVISAGITPTHVDGHKYIHLLPGITAIVVEIALRYKIPVVREPVHVIDPLWDRRFKRLSGLLMLAFLARMAIRTVRRAGLRTPDHFAGFMDTGHLTKIIIQRLLARPYQGLTELICHPAYWSSNHDILLSHGYHWIAEYHFEQETAAVSDPDLRRYLDALGWDLCNFGD